MLNFENRHLFSLNFEFFHHFTIIDHFKIYHHFYHRRKKKNRFNDLLRMDSSQLLNFDTQKIFQLMYK